MSTTTAAAAVKPVRKFPPPCWTRDEALVLIEAYRERWYALHRAFLKNPDWDAVAEKVTTSCPDVTPPKTSAQCRHKMEKLRQRHRAEKLRASSFTGGRFLSSWFYFDAMESMENGPDGSNPDRGIRFKPTPVEKFVALPASPPNYTPNFDFRVSNQENGYFLDSYKNHKPGLRKSSKVAHDQENLTNLLKNENFSGKKKKKREIHEVVSSIKLLGDGFMKIEKMKIDMIREIEQMRMETEMKRNELILESQRQIVDAFVKGLIGTRKQARTDM